MARPTTFESTSLTRETREGVRLRTETEHPADPRFEHEADQELRQLIREDLFSLAPEEYAARHGHDWLLFSYHLYRYRDAKLGAWVRRVGELLENPDELERWRERLLSPDERAEISRRQAEEW